MEYDNDHLLLARARHSDHLDALALTHFGGNPLLFLTRLESIRESGGADQVIENYTEILREAIGCKILDAAIAESMLASVAMRLRM